MSSRTVLRGLLLAALPGVALAQTGVTQNPPVPARPPVTAGSSPVASDASPPPPPDRIAQPQGSSTAGPGLAGGAAGAPLTGAATQTPAQPSTRR